MTIDVEISGVDQNGSSAITKLINRKKQIGPVVYTDDLLQYNQRSLLFFSEEGSRNLNIDGSFGGTPEGIHNGTDSAEWTAAATVGTWDFASTAQANTGTKSIEALNMSDGDTATISKGSDLAFANFTSITGFIYLTRFNTSFQEILISFTDNGVLVGASMDLINFIDGGLLNAWQKFSIPKAALGQNGTTVDAMVLQFTSSGGSAPRAYFDDIQIEETGGVEFIARPANGNTVIFDRYEFLFADALAGTVADGTMAGLDHNKILGLASLTNGFSFQRVAQGVPQVSLVMRNFGDMMGFTFQPMPAPFSDGTNTIIKMVALLPEPAVLNGKTGDKVTVTINDDMSGLQIFRIILVGKELTNG